MKLDKALRRDKKRHKRRNGMTESGRSVFTIQEELIKRGQRKRSEADNG